MAKIFISYRRNDSAYIAATIHEKVQQHFGRDSAFFDIDNIPLGVDFRQHIDDAVGQCDVLLVIIGDHWIRQGDDREHRHLDDPVDYVRIEVESAFKRNIPVVPVLVGDAMMPSQNDLPPSIQDLVYRNATQIRAGSDLRQHLDRLIGGLENICGSPLSSSDMQDEQLSISDSNRTNSMSHDSDTRVALQEIRALLTGCSNANLHVAPGIPQDMLRNAINKYAKSLKPDDVLLLYETSPWASMILRTVNQVIPRVTDGLILRVVNGLCLTLTEIYWHNLTLFADSGMISYGQIEKIEYGGWGDSAYIAINGHKIGVKRRELAKSMVNIILYLKDRGSRRAQTRD